MKIVLICLLVSVTLTVILLVYKVIDELIIYKNFYVDYSDNFRSDITTRTTVRAKTENEACCKFHRLHNPEDRHIKMKDVKISKTINEPKQIMYLTAYRVSRDGKNISYFCRTYV